MQRKEMRRPSLPWLWSGWGWWSLGCLLFLTGCNSLSLTDSTSGQNILGRSIEDPLLKHLLHDGAAGRVRRKDDLSGITLASPPVAASPGKPIPIALDTVFRMAHDHNGQVRLARMKVEEAFADQEMARKHWIPDLTVGMSTWRHDGGIADFQGNLLSTHYTSALAGVELRGKYDWKETLVRRVEAERKYWQQQGELSKLTNENLLDAASTYTDLLALRVGVSVSLETEARLNDLLKQATALAKIEDGMRVEVSAVERELAAQSVVTVKLREASKAASAKLAYLLGLDPCCDIVTADRFLVPIKLVDASQPAHCFVDKVLEHGPGIRELEGLLRTVQAARDTNYGFQHWLPSIDVALQEGGFGTSPGSQLQWTNRFDLRACLTWEVNQFLYSRYKRQQANMHIQQVHQSYHDLRLKLTLGVQEARESILGGEEQLKLAERHVARAEESYRLSKQRLEQNIKGRSTSEVLLALRSLAGARLEYLHAVRDLNKAQLRLYTLVGIHEPGAVQADVMK